MDNSVNLHTNFILTLFQTGITYFLLWKNKRYFEHKNKKVSFVFHRKKENHTCMEWH